MVAIINVIQGTKVVTVIVIEVTGSECLLVLIGEAVVVTGGVETTGMGGKMAETGAIVSR